MILNIRLKNYKAFEDAISQVKPITVLLGANNTGQNSLINLMIKLQQTGKAGMTADNPIASLYTSSHNLGDDIKLYENKLNQKPLQIGFEIKSEKLKLILEEEIINNFTRAFNEVPLCIPVNGYSTVGSRSIRTYEDFRYAIDNYIELLSEEKIYPSILKELNWIIKQKKNVFLPRLNRRTKKQFISTFLFLQNIASVLEDDIFTVNYQFIHSHDNISASLIEIKHHDCSILKLTNNELNEINLSSDINKFENKEMLQLQEFFNSKNTIFNSFTDIPLNKELNVSVLTSVIVNLFKSIQQEVKKEFFEESISI